MTIHFGRRRLVHPPRKVADLEAFHGCARVELEMAGNAAHIARIRASNSLEHQHGVFHAARHRPELIKRPAERHRASPRYATIRGTQSRETTAHAGTHNTAFRFAADRE